MNNTLVNDLRSLLFKNGIWIAMGLFMIVTITYAIFNAKWVYLGVVFVPGLIYLTIRNPFVFFFGLYALLIPLDTLLLRTASNEIMSLTKYIAIFTIVSLSVRGALEDKFKKPDPIVIGWFLLIIYCILTTLWAIKPELTQNNFRNAAGLLVLYLVVASYKINEKDYDRLKLFIIAGGFLTGLVSIYSYGSLSQSAENIDRIGVQIGDRASKGLNSLSFCLLIPISMVIGKILEQNKIFTKVIFCLILIPIIFCSVALGSRGGMLGIGAIVAVYFLFSRKKVTFLSIVIPIIIFVIFFLGDMFWGRWESAIDTGGAGRVYIWQVGLKALEKYWLIGAGLSNFPAAYDEFFNYAPALLNKAGRAAHNLYLGMFVELGIIGFAIMIFVFISHYKAIQTPLISNKYALDTIMLKASFVSILVSSFFLDPFFDKPFWLLWMLILIRKNALGKSLALRVQER